MNYINYYVHLRRDVGFLHSLFTVIPSYTFQALEKDHKIAMSALQSQHEEELSRLREQSRHEPPTRDSDDELTELKRRLCLLEEGYEAQISALKQQYEESIGSQPDMCEEKVRQRYQVEIEHLRVSVY